jgi:uncharacterized protein YjbJ (UPF0337 family)
LQVSEFDKLQYYKKPPFHLFKRKQRFALNQLQIAVNRCFMRTIAPEHQGVNPRHGSCSSKYRQQNKTKQRKTHNIMNTLELKGNWNIAKGKLKQKYAQLTDEDLRFAEGKQDELIGRIQKRTGETKEAIEKALNNCFADKR